MRLFATCAPGLDAVLRQEMRAMGLKLLEASAGEWQGSGEDSGGGVEFEGELPDLYRANLHLRTASRVLRRMGDFHAENFNELRKKASKIEWEQVLSGGAKVVMHVTCHKSRLYHSGAVAERVLAAVGDRLGRPPVVVRADEAAASGEPPQMIVVRLSHDHATLSADTSGALLHRRGYRLETAKAPLRETLAAALLLAAGYDGSAPLLDPFCGSGTIPVEAALIALGIPPGMKRPFTFQKWPKYNAAEWQSILSAVPTPPAKIAIRIQGSDRDAGAVAISQSNAARAGVADYIEFTHRAVSAIEPPPGPGFIVTNPPYGQRISQGKDLRNLYAQMGSVFRAKCPGWTAAILCSDLTLLGQTGLKLDTSFSTVNGGLGVRLGRGRIESR